MRNEKPCFKIEIQGKKHWTAVVFQGMCKIRMLRRKLHVKWSGKVTNTTLWEWTKQLPT